MKRCLTVLLILCVVFIQMEGIVRNPAKADTYVDGDGNVYTYSKYISDSIEITGFEHKGSTGSVEIPGEIDNKAVKHIGEYAFSGDEKLTKVTIPKTVFHIHTHAFDSCSGLTTVQFEEDSGCHYIEGYAFYNCGKLVSINLPSGITEIESGSFSNCTSLESINLPSGITEIGESAFSNCTSLKSISFPSSVEHISRYAFQECESLETVTFEANSNLNAISDFVFDFCHSLKSIILPAKLDYMGTSVFYRCYNLTSVTFGEVDKKSHIDYIGSAVFLSTGLSDVYFVGSKTEWDSVHKSSWINDDEIEENITIHYCASTWSDLKDNLKAGGTVMLTKDVTGSPSDPLEVPSGVTATLELNGHTIDRGLTSATNNGCILVNSGKLTITGNGTLKGAYNTGSGGAIVNNGTLTIDGGTFTNNTAKEAGAVYNAGGATLTVNGGTFENNQTTEYGGGAFVNKGTMTMTGGTVQNNTAKLNGGGIWSNNSLTMTGGTIRDNHADGWGGGVFVKAADQSTFRVSGSPVISGNTNSSAAEDVYLDYKPITVIGALSGTASIGVTAADPDDVIVTVQGYNGGNLTDSDASIFFSNDPDYAISPDSNGQAHLRTAIKAEDVTIENPTYNGADQSGCVRVVQGGKELKKDTDYTVAFRQKGKVAKPVDVGEYEVTVTGSGDFAGSVTKTLTISKAVASIVTAPTAKENLFYNGTAQKLLNADGVAEGGTLYYAITEKNKAPAADTYSKSIPAKKEKGTWYVWYKVVGDKNHTDSDAASLAVTISEPPTVQSVITLFSALPEAGAVTLNDRAAIESARAAYDALTEAEREIISAEDYQRLLDAEAALAALPTDPPVTPKTDISGATIGSIGSQAYTGNPITPNLDVKVEGRALTLNSDYTVTWENNTKIGTATATLTGIGDYEGTKQITFKIYLKGVELAKLKAGSKQLTIKWKKGSHIDGYEIQVSLKKNFKKAKTVKIKKAKTSTVVKKLEGGKKYFIRIRTWKKIGKKTYYSAWSKVKTLKTKK